MKKIDISKLKEDLKEICETVKFNAGIIKKRTLKKVCEKLEGRKEPRQIEIPITDDDMQMFGKMMFRNETINWVFQTQYGENIEVIFMTQDEYEQRGK